MVLTQRLSWAMVGETLGQRVKRLRLKLGLTQAELGAAAGVTTQAVNQIERGRRVEIEPKTREGLAAALGVSETYLITGVESLHDGQEWPSIDSYLRATTNLTEAQIDYVHRSYEAMQSERQLAELRVLYAAGQQDGDDPLTHDAALHPPGTMPEIEPVAADDDSDVKRAQRQREARREQKQRDQEES